jgi:hypothetical protein
MKQRGRPRPPAGQRWCTFVQNRARDIVACDFFTSITATFQVLYVLVAIQIGTRRLWHVNVTDHPTAEWTRQQFREFLDGESGHPYVLHDRDTAFSPEVDEALSGLGLKVATDIECHPAIAWRKTPVLGGLHQEYRLQQDVA